MAGSLNQVSLIGNLGKDPEICRTQDGRPVGNISIATSESWRDKATGEKREHTEGHRVVIFNENLAKVAEQYLKKGSRVFVQGKLQTRKWTDQAGVEKYSTEVVLGPFNAQLTLLDKVDRPAPSESDYGTQRNVPAAGAGTAKRTDLDDEIPF